MKAIILSAGQGRRLLPLTKDQPKCLLRVCGSSVLDWQLRGLEAAGVASATVVTGFAAHKVQAHLAKHPPGIPVQTIFNPLFAQADNLVSCLAAREAMQEDFLLLNGDTLFDPAIVQCLLDSPSAPVSVAVAHKGIYDDDDMKVTCRGGLIHRIGKDLRPPHIDGEAIGISYFRGNGPRQFVETLQRIAGTSDGQRRYYLSAIAELATRGMVRAVDINGYGWEEIDFPRDLTRAAALSSRWLAPSTESVPEQAAIAL